jgi:hypothetical protein
LKLNSNKELAYSSRQEVLTSRAPGKLLSNSKAQLRGVKKNYLEEENKYLNSREWDK